MATKVFLAESLLVNVAVIRETKANQFGLLGFGVTASAVIRSGPRPHIAYLLTRKFAIGSEIRTGLHNLNVDDQTNAWTLFAAGRRQRIFRWSRLT